MITPQDGAPGSGACRRGHFALVARSARVALAALVASAVMAVSATAHARSFSTDAFAIELGAPRVCFVVPVSLHEAAACRGLPPVTNADLDTSQLDLVAAGGIRSESDGGPPLMGLVQMFRSASAMPHHPEAKVAERLAVDIAKAATASLPDTARRRKLVTRVETVEGITVVRTSLVYDGLPAGTRASYFAHVETASTFGSDAIYTVVWSGPPASAAALTRLADAAAKTVRVDASKHPTTDEGPALVRAATTGALVVTPLLALAFVISRRQSRRRRGKPQGLRSELWPAHEQPAAADRDLGA